jgi:hypothetical protein
MRQVSALVVSALVASLAGSGASHASPRAARVPGISSLSSRLPPSRFVVRPDISDPLCNGGRGVRLRIPTWRWPDGETGTADAKSATIAGGSTLIAFSSLSAGGTSYAVLHSLTRGCALDREFGTDGTATVRVPSSLLATHLPQYRGLGGLWVEVVAARIGGGAILAGSYRREWVVGEITAHGQLDRAFGDGGWSKLPFEGSVQQVLQEPSGRIIVGAQENGSGCCTKLWAAALSAHGQLERTFGGHGRVELPTGSNSNIASLRLEPTGQILVGVGGGHMGCWYTKLAMLTPSGEPVPLFEARLAQFQRTLGLEFAVGDAYTEGEGFTVVETGQEPCFTSLTASPPPATGLIARFRANGEPAGPVIRFPTQLYGNVNAFSDGAETFLVQTPIYDEPALTTLALRQADGSLDPQFGNLGEVQIRTPRIEREAPSVEIVNSSPQEITLTAAIREAAELELIRLRL